MKVTIFVRFVFSGYNHRINGRTQNVNIPKKVAHSMKHILINVKFSKAKPNKK